MNMKKINVISKSLLLLCLLCLADIAGAQVTGNQYKLFDTKSGLNRSIQKITAEYEDGTKASGTYNNKPLEIMNAFDGNSGNFWSSSKAKNVNIDIKFTEAKDFVGFNIYRSGTNADLESGIEVYTSENGTTWSENPIATFEKYEVRSFNAFLPNAVKTQYLRLKLIYTGTVKVSVDEITLYGSMDNNDYGEIQHKRAKWFDLRRSLSEAAKVMDTFSDETEWYQLNGKNIQAAHTYIDTIYAHKGTTVELSLPERIDATSTSINSYQRWYSFRTDATFRTKNTGEDEVWDLLTTASKDTPYRFENGYVGRPMTTDNVMDMNFYVPTDEQFKEWFPGSTVDNNYYIVACDVSAYTDYTAEFDVDDSKNSTFYQSGRPTTYEPTLAHRVLFYIICVDGRTGSGSTGGPAGSWDEGFGRLTQDDAYKGGYGKGKKFLEERTINMSAKRVAIYTQELVALTKDARSFAIPDVAPDDDSESVVISLEDNTAGIELLDKTISGVKRTIRFKYPKENSDGTWSVKSDNSHAVICVTKTVKNITYNLARYTLVFQNEQQLLTETQLAQIADGSIEDTELLNYTYRTPSYLEKNYQLLTELNFDYDPTVAETYGKDRYYPFPLEWGSSSYAFYDGASGNDFKNSNKFPEWGYYAIQNGPVEWDTSTASCELLEGSTYHLYIDASDRPGLIAHLPFEDKLCRGSELFVTAMVNSAKGDADDASMLLTIMGVKKGAAVGGQDAYTPLYTYSTGQIPKASRLSGRIPGTGPGQNDWYQVYFSFINDNDVEYDSYVLQIENNSYSTNGGDMYLDNIQVYVATPSAEVTQLDASCEGKRTLMGIKLNWERLLSRIGATEGTERVEAIDFCFIDKAKYNEYLEEHATDYAGAIEASVVEVGNNDPDDEHFYSQKYNTLYFNLDFDKNTDYDGKNHPRLAKDNYVGDEGSRKYYFYGTDVGEKALAVDFYAALEANRPYLMLININDGTPVSASTFEESMTDNCGIKTSFFVTAQNLIRVNGEIVDPETDFCAGQIFNFSPKLRIPKTQADGSVSYIDVETTVYFDWFFGTENEFKVINSTYGVSLEEALGKFRADYPDKENLIDVSATGSLTDEHINLIKEYLESDGPEGALNNRLVLHKEKLDITLLSSGLQLVVKPIWTILSSSEIGSDDLSALVCWDYIYMELATSGKAPHLQPGFNPVKYPSDDFNPNLRIGLKQIKEVSGKDNKNTLTIDLRNAEYASSNVSNIGPLTSQLHMQYLFLIGSDDPLLKEALSEANGFTQYALPVGWIVGLSAQEYTTGSSFDNYVKIRFDLDGKILSDELHENKGFKFNPREGYQYTFAIPFEEKLGGEGGVSTACYGQFNLTMKVVPEYLEWVGKTENGKYANWNNDDNWKRIKSVRMKKTNVTDAEKDYFTDGTNGTTNGFVPMLFTKVIMPENSQVELYAAGYNGTTSIEWDTNRPTYIAAPTENIQYDLMAFESGSPLKTERYRVSLLDEIHFEPGAEMKHAEYLLYNKAWVDYKLDGGRWYTLASPLKDVVAGDFYTDKSGTEGSEYFQPIEFNYGTELTNNDRFSPSVYQRGWKGSNATMVGTPGGERAISGNWSALYNKVDEAYTPGTGFSLKVQDVTDSATFRLPKADTEYYYYSQNGAQGSDKVSGISKVNAHRLQSDEIYQRTDNSTVGSIEVKEFTVPLDESADGQYYLVGNPFMAHLNMREFFTQNVGVIKPKYWAVDDGVQDVAVVNPDADSWISVGENSTATVAPLQSFFVQKAKGVTDDITLTFTQKMQTLGGTGDGLRSANALMITATTDDGRQSRAAVAYDMAASADYEASEDAELFLDSNLGDVPMVYTVAGTMATSINRTSELYNIPLGVYGNKQEMVTLSFGGLNQFSSATLYDAQEQTETPLHEGKTVSVPAGTSGRYFLRAGTPTGNEVIARNAFLVYSVGGGKVMVTSSNTPLKDIRVYTMGGAQVRSIQASGMQQEIYLNRGIYLITVSDQDGLQETRKVLVR